MSNNNWSNPTRNVAFKVSMLSHKFWMITWCNCLWIQTSTMDSDMDNAPLSWQPEFVTPAFSTTESTQVISPYVTSHCLNYRPRWDPIKHLSHKEKNALYHVITARTHYGGTGIIQTYQRMWEGLSFNTFKVLRLPGPGRHVWRVSGYSQLASQQTSVREVQKANVIHSVINVK